MPVDEGAGTGGSAAPPAAWYQARGLRTNECLGYYLETCAGFWPGREMVSMAGVRHTYRGMHRWSLAVAHQLVASGFRPGDRIMIQAVNSIELLVVQFAAWRIGAVTVPIVPMYRAHELKSVVADVSPRVIVASGQVGSRCYSAELDAMLAEIGHAPLLKVMLGPPPAGSEWTPLPGPPPADAAIDEAGLPPAADADSCAVILYTSGSTAAPKGAMLRSGAIVGNARTFQRSVGLGQGDVSLCATPLGHTGALINSMIVPMAGGGRAVVLPAWNPDDAIAAIAREKITFMSSPPLILQDLVERYETLRPEGHRLSKFYGGGGGVAPSLVERAEAVGMKALRAYGMTETTGNITVCHTDDAIEKRANFDGYCYYGSELTIVDEARCELPVGSVGEIRVRGPLLMLGYTDPRLNEAQLDAQGWFYTGDLGRLDAAGWLRIEGRIKDIINRGGEKFSSQDIEAVIASFPDITDVAVVAAPHPRYGEVVAAFIRLREGARWDGPEAALAHLEAARLTKQKWPVEWHVLDEFPRTPSGKVQKQALRALLWDRPQES